MKKRLLGASFLLLGVILLGGCGGPPVASIGGGSGPSAPVNLVMTDTPPAGVSVLSFQVTLSSATLSPGNVALLAAPVSFEVTRLQTENALLNSQSVAAGTYTSVTLAFANPVMTFRNDGTSAVTVGGTNCPAATVCTALSPSLTNSSVTVALPLTITANTPVALLADLNLSSFLIGSGGTMTADAQAANAVSVSAPAASQGAFNMLEDVVGVVSNASSANGTFQLQTALGTYSLTTGAGTSGTVFLNFPASGSCAANFACIANGQIVSVDMDLLTNDSLLATDVFFEDAASSPPEIEGIVVATSGLTPPAQFQMVVLQATPPGSGPAIGSEVTVAPATAETFDVDALGTGTVANGYSFTTVSDVIVGQEVQVQMGTGSTNSQLVAPRVRLRSSRITALVSNISLPNIYLGNGSLPPFFGSAGISLIQGFVLAPPNLGAYTEVGGTAVNISQIAIGNSVSLRGQLFKNGTTFPMVATKIVKH